MAAFFDGDGGDAGEKGFADSFAAVLGLYEEVFDVDAGVAAPGGVVVEVERKACGDGVAGLFQLGDEDVEARRGSEAGWESVAEEVGFGGVDGVGLALVLGERANEGEDERDVSRCRGTDGEHGWFEMRCGGGLHRERWRCDDCSDRPHFMAGGCLLAVASPLAESSRTDSEANRGQISPQNGHSRSARTQKYLERNGADERS